MSVPSSFLSRLSASCIAAVLCAGAAGSDTSRPVSDETLRLVAVRGVFPKTQVSVDPGVKIDDSSPATEPFESPMRDIGSPLLWQLVDSTFTSGVHQPPRLPCAAAPIRTFSPESRSSSPRNALSRAPRNPFRLRPESALVSTQTLPA